MVYHLGYALEHDLLVQEVGCLAPGTNFCIDPSSIYWGVSYYFSSEFRVMASSVGLLFLSLTSLLPRLL